ncbi:hypothetical protein E1287_27630 [Actinomadura sp. KC06]|uniref:hypothetical protein n=1 Tax=Actinomadura sp. KC06 TaxID=2530369 RepID=UPI001045618A|nr:hypothetical protein [Actinomadura sp. KC06]TDD31079.1 hypothetical protein E1287_27630 [Actinomadura sp. KC06]
MTYRWDGFHGRALYELNGIPDEVRDGPLLNRLLDLLEAPWDAVPERPGQTALRHAFFGDNNEGMLTILVDEESETLRIIDILWTG